MVLFSLPRNLWPALLACVLMFLTGCSHSSLPAEPNVILILLDTLRADHLGYYGYERDTSPVLDQFAKENIACSYTVSTASWTPVSVASIFTGYYAATHGMVPPTSSVREQLKAGTKLNSDFITITEYLKNKGYSTNAITANAWFSNEFGFGQGFDAIQFYRRKPADFVTDTAIKTLDESIGKKSPFFLYLHYFDPHHPYIPPGEFANMYKGPLTQASFKYPKAALGDLGKYDGEVRYLDTQLGRLFAYLREQKLYDNSIIIVVSDHGEQFLEHGELRHGMSLHNEEVHVPLFIHTGRSSDKGRVVKELTSTIDIMPTLLELLGIPAPPTLPGISLFNSGALKSRSGVISEVERKHWVKQFTRNDGKKILFTLQKANSSDVEPKINLTIEGVFDAKNDYFEQTPLTDDGLSKALEAGFRGIYQPALQTRSKIVQHEEETSSASDKTLKELKSLGYFQ